MRQVACGPISGGLSGEVVTFFVADDVRRVARQYFCEQNRTIIEVMPGAAAAGVVTVGTLGALFWGPAKGIVDKAVEDLKDLPGEIKDAVIQAIDDAGISTAEQPKFTSDAYICLKTHPATITILGQKVKDPLRGLKILNCMRKKGWAEDIVIEGIAQIFIY